MIGIGIGVAHANYVKAIAPTGLTISIVSTGLKLDWTNVAGNTGYQVYNSTDNITYAQIGADLAANAVTYTHVIATGILNYYKIRTVKNGKYSDFTAVVSAIPAIYFTLTKTGDGTGVSTLAMTVSENITLTLSANATFYTDAAGTLNASQTWAITTGASRTIYIKCTTGTATLTIPKAVITSWGTEVVSGWTTVTNSPSITAAPGALSTMTIFRITGASTLTGAMPTGLTYLYLSGASIAWTYNGALPTGLTGLTYLLLSGNSIAWTYNGALPTGLTYLLLSGNSIAWTYNGALPTGLTYLFLEGASIAWTYNGALPTGLTYLWMVGASIAWTYNGALPTGLTILQLIGASIAWTYNGALPTGLTYLVLYGALIAWTYTGALPTGLTSLTLRENGIAWTYNGALPTGLTSLTLRENGIAWTYTGAMPTGLTYLYLSGASIAWTYNGALPTGITILQLSGASIAWTGLDVTGTGAIATFNLANFRTDKMSSADMVTLLTSMTNRAGALPNTCTINDYADYASPPTAVTNAVATLKTTKSITTVNLGA
jgi:hypothetical protein